MRAVDTSVAIPMFASWHEDHGAVTSLLSETLAIPAHAMLETYAVLTRLPEPHRAPGPVVATWLDRQFDEILDPPAGKAHRRFVRRLGDANITGGRSYDALVAATCIAHGRPLVSADDRARRTYDELGLEVIPIA